MDQPANPIAPATPAGIRPAVWLGLLTVYLVWGSTYIGIRVAIETIPPFTMAAIRFLIAGLLLLVWCVIRDRGSFRVPSRREWRDTFVVGALLLGGGMGMVAWGEQTVPAGIAAILVAMLPAWIAVLGRVFFRELLPRAAGVGIVVGMAGVAILVGPSGIAGDAVDPAGALALILSPIMWGIGSLFASHGASLPANPLVGTGTQMLSGGAVLIAMAFVAGEAGRVDLSGVSGESVMALAYLVLIGSLVGFSTYGWLLRVAPLPLIATYAYVNPVVAVVLGWLILGEAITPRTLVAGSIIVFAVALIITARARMAAPRPRPLSAPLPSDRGPNVAPVPRAPEA